ncbi:MAG TPA: dUTPase [Nitrososphaeraceae archaeon]|nr:dUTPase [Nitrososphaeraceae archaeon]
MDKLEKLIEMQRNLAGVLASPRYPSKMEERISYLCTAITHESIELQRLTNWKWWKTPTEFDLEEAKEELIDIWHFILQATIELDMTADDVVKYYSKKNKINKKRKKLNY